MLDGKPRFRTVGHDLELARAQRASFVRAARFGVVASARRLRLETVASRWLERYERLVYAGHRRVRRRATFGSPPVRLSSSNDTSVRALPAIPSGLWAARTSPDCWTAVCQPTAP
jgi:hypothetical protein